MPRFLCCQRELNISRVSTFGRAFCDFFQPFCDLNINEFASLFNVRFFRVFCRNSSKSIQFAGKEWKAVWHSCSLDPLRINEL